MGCRTAISVDEECLQLISEGVTPLRKICAILRNLRINLFSILVIGGSAFAATPASLQMDPA